MHPAKLIKRIKFCFFERLNKKIGWRRDEIKEIFEEATIEALEKYLDEMGQRDVKQS
jgi:hypothetical protein